MSRRLLVVASTRPELACHPRFPGGEPQTESPWALWRNGDLSFLECGPGPVPAGSALAWALTERHYGLVLGIGIAGAWPESGLKIGQVRRISSESFADFGAEDHESWIDFPDLQLPGLPETNDFPLFLPKGADGVKATTASAATGSETTARKRWERTGAAIESMEGAAWALCCQRFGVSLAEVRAISNITGPRHRDAWKIPEALHALATFLVEKSFRP